MANIYLINKLIFYKYLNIQKDVNKSTKERRWC